MLLQHNADVNVINGEGQTPRDVAKLEDVAKLLLAAEQTEARKKEECLLAAAREGDLETLKMLASGHCQDKENRKVIECRKYAQQSDKISRFIDLAST